LKREEYLIFILEIAGSALIGFFIGSLLLLVLGFDPLKSFSSLIIGGLYDLDYLLSEATFVMLTGLAFSIPAMASVFNIGGEGQVYLGALASLIVAHHTGNILLSVLIGVSVGALVGGLMGILKVYKGVNEVITAIMLNWIFYYITLYLITNIYYNPLAPYESIRVPKSSRIGYIDTPLGRIHLIFFISIITCIITYIVLYNTKIGYSIRVSGLSYKSAEYAGFNPSKNVVYSLVMGGVFGGLSGALKVVGFSYSIDTTMSSLYGIGFDGIGVALLGRNNPLGIIFSSIFYSMLIVGGHIMQIELNAPKELVDTLIGTLIIALSLPYAYRIILSKFKIMRMVRRF